MEPALLSHTWDQHLFLFPLSSPGNNQRPRKESVAGGHWETSRLRVRAPNATLAQEGFIISVRNYQFQDSRCSAQAARDCAVGLEGTAGDTGAVVSNRL